MSETTETTPAPEPEPTPTPAPESTPAETEEQPQREAEEEPKSRGDRRFAELTARLSAAERREQQREAELEFYRRQIQQQAPQDDTPEQAAQRLRMQVRAEVEAEIKVKNLHDEGRAQYPDWGQRAQRVVDMGGDAEFSQLIVDMPPREAVRLVGALAEDPEALQRIVDLKGERARAVALGKYAATLDADDGGTRTPRAAPQVTRAPAPIRPVTGRASPQVNLYTMSGQQAVDYFMKEDLEKRMRR